MKAAPTTWPPRHPALVFEFPVSPSQNTVNGWLRGRFGFHRYKKHRDAMAWLIRQQMLDQGAGPRWVRTGPGQRRTRGLFGRPALLRVRIVRHSPGELDYGNLVGGCKALIDAMVSEGVLFDDSPEWCLAQYLQKKCKRGESRTTVEIANG